MPEYAKADYTVVSLLNHIIETRYPRLYLLSPALDIRVLMVSAKLGTPALKKGGWPALGLVSIVSEKDRAAGGPDVLIQLDERYWENANPVQRRALLDHELYHVEVAARSERDDSDTIVRYIAECDGQDRPTVTLRPHDFEVGGFKEICEIYGEAAPERHAVNEINRMLDEPTLPFMRADDPVKAAAKAIHDSVAKFGATIEVGVPEPAAVAASVAPRSKTRPKGPDHAQAQV